MLKGSAKMCDVKVCRICFRRDSKFYHYDKYYLKSYYEEVLALPVNSKDGLPRFFCYQCAALLVKFHRFREKCHYSQKLLIEMLWRKPITYDSIAKIDLNRHPIITNGNIEILTLSKRVKNFNVIQNDQCKPDVEKDDYEDNSSDSDFSCKNYDFKNSSSDNSEEDEEIELSIELNNQFVEIRSAEKVGAETLKPAEFKENETDIEKKQKEVTEPVKPKEITKVQPHIKKTAKAAPTRLTRKRKAQIKKDDSELRNTSEIISEAKKYKFAKAKEGNIKTLQFLDSGFWKKSTLSEEDAMKEFVAKAQDPKYVNSPYKCTDCHKPFSQKIMLDRHILRKHGEAAGSILCRFCKMRFKRACFLTKHMRQHLTKYECLRCNLVCNVDTTALFHEEYHNGVIRRCPHCEKEFRHLSSFYTHLRTHRSKHMCTLCGESFVSQLGLRQHKRLKHVTETENQQAADGEVNTYCDVCKIKFERKEAYDKHLLHSAMHTGEALEDNTTVQFSDDIDDENKAQELHKRKSKVEKTLSAFRKSNLPPVAGAGWTRKPTTCQHCGKHFDSQSACRKHHLKEHLRAPFYTASDRVICEICGASLAPGSVNAHINQHTRRKMFTCETCGRSFTTNHVLRNHMATHTGERNHPCSICGKRFTQNGSLSLHYRTVHLKQPYVRDRKKKVEEPSTGVLLGKVEFL